MAITTTDLLRAANRVYVYETIDSGDPVDNFTYATPLSKWFMGKKQPKPFFEGIVTQKVRLDNQQATDWYRGDDQQLYKTKEPPQVARFMKYNAREGFTVNMEDLADAGVQVIESGTSRVTKAEKNIITDLIRDETQKMKDQLRMDMDIALHNTGTEGANTSPGLGYFVPISPSGNTIGGISETTYPAWANYTDIGVSTATAGNVIAALKKLVRGVQQRGAGLRPEIIFTGGTGYDAYAADCGVTVNRNMYVNGKGGATLDAAIHALNYDGIPVVYDPILDYMQGDSTYTDATNPWDKRFYALTSKAIHFHPHSSRWMQNYQPSPTPNMPETLYWGTRTTFGLSISQLNALGVMTIA